MTIIPSDASQAVELPPLPEERLKRLDFNAHRDTGCKVGSWGHLLAFARLIEADLREDRAARAQAEPVLPEGWVPCTIAYTEGDEPEEIAFGPQRMMDRLKKWLDSYFAMLYAQRYPAARAQGAGEAVAGPSGDLPSDFQEGQWWLVKLDEVAAAGTDDMKRAVAVVRNLMKTAHAQVAAPTIPQAAEVPGFVLVPREPTPAMMRVGLASMWPRAAYQNAAVENVWIRMCRVGADPSTEEMTLKAIAAAPTPTASAPKAEGEAPRVPANVIQAISAYGDSRADGMNSGDAIGAAIKAIRQWAAALTQPPSEADRTREGGDDMPGMWEPADVSGGETDSGTTTSEGAK